MLKHCCRLFSLLLLLVTVCFLEGETRPQFVEALDKVTEALNDTAITLVQKLLADTPSHENNKTKKRILFRGDLLGDLEDHDIIFPDSYQVVFDNVPRITGPPKCAGSKTFCETVDSYPYGQVKDILRRKNVNSNLFGKDEPLDDRYSITNRNGDFESFLCSSVEKTVFPRVGKNKNNKWKYIINQGESDGFIQGVRIEVCRKEGSACDLLGEGTNGYITSCKQKYMSRRMISISENGDPVPDTFLLPSACCCSYRKDVSFLSRFGADDVSGRTKIKKKQ